MKRNGFTLVEVLITVGIIGVVAALTIPTVIQNSNNRKFASQFKKTLSTLSQAAIMSQAQYDSDYSSLNTASSSENCAEESLAKSNLTMCGLLNSTLSGHTFLGMYGTAKGANARSIYTVSKNVLPDAALSTENTMIFGLADGTIIGFNKNATNCGVMPGTPMSAEVLNGALANCIGFIDVNGPNPPNKEVTCDTPEYTTLDPTTSCAVKKAVSDVFPIVFHNGTVQPASNAANVVLSPGGKLTEAERIARRRQFDKWEAKEISQGLSQAECNQVKAKYGIKDCYYNGDKWAAAVVACGGVDKIASDDDLWALAKTIYTSCNCNNNSKVCFSGNYSVSCLDSSKVPSGLSGLGTSWETLWTSSESNQYYASHRVFTNSYTTLGSPVRYDSAPKVVCVGDLE